MSIEIDWARLTTGPDGQELAHTIRDFIHEKFQQVPLPRFIRSVHVHTFDFGEECPHVEIKDISDPWAEFYEDDGEDEGDEGSVESAGNIEKGGEEVRRISDVRGHDRRPDENERLERRQDAVRPDTLRQGSFGVREGVGQRVGLNEPVGKPSFQGRSDLFPNGVLPRPLQQSSILSRASTPGLSIPGGTSSLNHSYFTLPPLSAATGFTSGPHTPLATAFSSSMPPWTSTASTSTSALPQQQQHTGPTGASSAPTNPGDASSPTDLPDRNPMDIQVTAHITYTGDLSLSLTAELLIDYPMPSFMSIPLSLRIKGVTFDGVAVLAYLRPNKAPLSNAAPQAAHQQPQWSELHEAHSPLNKAPSTVNDDEVKPRGRCQICFLAEEEGRAVLGEGATGHAGRSGTGSALREILIETAIGRQSTSSMGDPGMQHGNANVHKADEHNSDHEAGVGSLSNPTKSIPPASSNNSPAERRPEIAHTQSSASTSSHNPSSATTNTGYEETSMNNQHSKPIVLKNVGKVERFVLEQVRRIFEEEFVWPSFWTVLL